MSFGAVSSDHWADTSESASEKETFVSEAAAAEYLLVEIGAPRSSIRGRLSLALEGAIERTLESVGAPSPSSALMRGFEGILEDQLRRARVVGAPGIALWIPSLLGIAEAGVLATEDSGAIRAWLAAERERTVKLGFDRTNLSLGVYLEPLPLGALLRPAEDDGAPQDDAASLSDAGSDPLATSSSDAPVGGADSEPSASGAGVSSGVTDAMMAGADASADEGDGTDAGGETADADEAAGDGFSESARRMAEALGDDGETGWLRDALIELSTPPPRPVRADDDEDSGTHTAHIEPPPPPPVAKLHIAFADPVPAAPPAIARAPEPAPHLDSSALLALETHCRELEAANGPKPLGVVERLFTTAYLPLRAAVDAHPEIPAHFREVADEWSRSFEKSYSDAFDALRVRTKRPLMVADLPDIALRIARLHGARTTQLLLVDGMRYDIGNAVHESLSAHVGQRAACAERFLVWAALPTTTAAQVELIGRGALGLKDFTGEVQSDLVVARGRKASTIRRLKTGNRDILKLDIVEARLSEPGGANPECFADIAEETAQRVAVHFETLQPRTLVMVFGDHGFVVERKDGGFEAGQGGAAPEEVLVPAFAWLVGAVH